MFTWKLAITALMAVGALFAATSIQPKKNEPQFQTSDRCLACHNSLVDASGEDVSIGFHWRASIMANSSRDPYWQASSRREVIEHPEAQSDIQDECSVCHMPITRYESKLRGKTGEIFPHLPINTDDTEHRQAADGVSCSVCHQITKDKLGTRESYNGGFVVHGPEADGRHAEYGPFDIQQGLKTIMRSSTQGYRPEKADHIRESELCATCHTLITTARGAGGRPIGELPEQMPYPEWLHSDYRDKKSCQNCHMPEIDGPVQISRVLGEEREGARLHSFRGGNFFMLQMLNRYRGELGVSALPTELTDNAEATAKFLGTQTATVAIENVSAQAGRLRADVVIRNKNGHKLPTAFPSRRAWLHFVVRDRNGQSVFESGALNSDGSIVGNDNDADPSKYEPHYAEIRSPDQVEIYESILGDEKGHVTTGLLAGVRYLKDNRLLPDGFDKRSADADIAVVGDALNDPAFTGGSHRVRYSVPLETAAGPFTIEAELWYQPIGYRWANNLKPFDREPEPSRFNNYFDSMKSSTAAVLARAALNTDVGR
ncbi:MAG: cytochrome c family protein [Acidobacteriota bacterium]|nr:cytochrome c family protein [Acidobacteriota bacterium]